jgi:hypothetical protein
MLIHFGSKALDEESYKPTFELVIFILITFVLYVITENPIL